MSAPIDVPVVIVGGGGCGLSLSAFLSNYGVDHVLFERHAGTSLLPKAHYLNQRTMEIFRLHGMNGEIAAKSCPARHMSLVAWATSLGGDGPLDRKVLHKFACFGGDDGSPTAQMYKRDAPEKSANLPLCRMEPILRQMATDKNPGKVLFGHDMTEFVDNGDSVTVHVTDSEGRQSSYRTQYLVGADGGRTIGQQIGVKMEGPTGITDMVSVHFGADLSQYWDDRYFACHFVNGACGTIFESGAIVPMGPTWGKYSEEWVFHFGFDLDDNARFQEGKLIPRIRDLLKIPNLDITVHKVSHWIIERVLADKYRQGRMFIAGDAAHRRPPTTGLGLNTAVEDAFNLAWKLSLVLNQRAPPSLLDTYESERRPVGELNCDWGLFTFQNSAVINAAVGLVPGQPESNRRRLASLFADSRMGSALRAQTAKMIESQRIEFSAHDIELGFRYAHGFFVPDDSSSSSSSSDQPHLLSGAALTDPLGQIYHPSTRPGHRLPHAWLELADDDRVVSTHDLVGPHGDWALITDAHGAAAWIPAAERAGRRAGITIRAVQVGTLAPPTPTPSLVVRDYDDRWAVVKGVKEGGAVLVRPDNVVGWRSRAPSQRDGGELGAAVERLFGRGGGPVSLTGEKEERGGLNGWVDGVNGGHVDNASD